MGITLKITVDLIFTYFGHVISVFSWLSTGLCERQCCSHALTIVGGLGISVNYHLYGYYRAMLMGQA